MKLLKIKISDELREFDLIKDTGLFEKLCFIFVLGLTIAEAMTGRLDIVTFWADVFGMIIIVMTTILDFAVKEHKAAIERVHQYLKELQG